MLDQSSHRSRTCVSETAASQIQDPESSALAQDCAKIGAFSVCKPGATKGKAVEVLHVANPLHECFEQVVREWHAKRELL